jgi:hypothetical protein
MKERRGLIYPYIFSITARQSTERGQKEETHKVTEKTGGRQDTAGGARGAAASRSKWSVLDVWENLVRKDKEVPLD